MSQATPFERRGCTDCAHLAGYASRWCTSVKASGYRGTNIPGIVHCPFWEPHYGRLTREERAQMGEQGYPVPSLRERLEKLLDAYLRV